MSEAKKKLSKKVREGFEGYPVATIALYGPNDKKATKFWRSLRRVGRNRLL